MSRHLNNLQRLWTKLQTRYGNNDALVLDVKRELDAIEARDHNWNTPQPACRKVNLKISNSQPMDQGLAA